MFQFVQKYVMINSIKCLLINHTHTVNAWVKLCERVSFVCDTVRSQCSVLDNSFGSFWFSMVLVGHGFINCLASESFVVSFS